VVGVLAGFDQHGQEFGVLAFFRREFVMAFVGLLQFGDEALILFPARMTAGSLRANGRP
jgi:hypothetical protein